MTAGRFNPALETLGVTAAVVAAAAGLTWVGIHNLLALAGLCYAAAYMALAYRWPAMGLTLVFAVAPFQNDLSGGGAVKFSLAEINLFLFTPTYLWRAWHARRQVLPMGPLTIPLILWFAACICSSFLHFLGGVAVVSIVQMVLYLVIGVTVFGFGVDDRRQLRLCLYGLVLVAAVMAAAALAGHPGTDVLGQQKNGVGASLGCAVVVCVELWLSEPPGRRRHLMLAATGLVTAGMFYTLSRGAWMGAVVGLAVVVVARGQVWRVSKLLMVLVPVAAACWAFLPQDKKDYVLAFDAKRENIRLRYVSVEYAKHLYEQSPVIGMGVGLRKLYDATNIVLLTLAETGQVGLIAFFFFQAVFLGTVWQAQRTVPRSDPRFTFLIIGVALVLSKLMHGMVDHYWGRGEFCIAWSAAGMAWGVTMAARAGRLAVPPSPAWATPAGSPAVVPSR